MDSEIHFANTIEESPEVNIMTYEYTYNGGGVAAGDFNNDGLCDLYFTGNTVSNRLYLNQGNLKFKDITKTAGLEGRPLWKTGVTAADANADGWLDLYVCYSGPELKQSLSNQLFINNGLNDEGELTFTERAAEFGLDAPGTYSTQASFFDYDRDGDLDMFLINHGNHFYSPFINTNQLRNTRHPQFGNRLYRNEMVVAAGSSRNPGNYFTEVSTEAGIHGGGLNFGLGISVSDVNGDEWPDIFVTNDYEEQDFLYLNNQDGTFTECTKNSFGHLSRNGMGTDIADFNNDGRTDLIEVDMWPEDNFRQKLLKGPDDFNRYTLMVDSGFHYQQMRNTLQMNAGIGPDGQPVFCEIGQLAGVSATDWSWAPLFADFDNDGFKDLFVTNGYLRDFTSMDFLKYTVEEARKKAQEQGTELQVYELVSKMPSTKTSDYLFKNNGDLTFTNNTREWGLDVPNLSFGAAYADLDNDGDQDLITNNTNEMASVWVNQSNVHEANNYLRVQLKGSQTNPFGVGARVYVTGGKFAQMSEQFLTRGYQSSVDPILHFGLGSVTVLEKVMVFWPDGKQSTKTDVKSNQLLTFDYSSSTNANIVSDQPAPNKTFRDISSESNINFVHHENAFVDFDREPLIPYQLSRLGPALAKGDVNNDGSDDFYVGGAAGQSGQLFIGDGLGHFVPAIAQPWDGDMAKEDIGASFFDADNDGDVDLFVVSGGNEYPVGSPMLDDRLYINLGDGEFTTAPAGATVADHVSGSCVAAADYDKDGDIDLFVGGRLLPGSFPLTAPGAILKNETDRSTRQIKFIVATKEVNSSLREPGMVTDALWTDFNGDTWPDLLIVGEWMPVRLFENKKGILVEVENDLLKHTSGFWNRISAADIDNDGDTDYVLGNAGNNLPWKVTENEPLTVYYTDLDHDGTIDPVVCNFNGGKQYPVPSRDELLQQVSGLRKIYTSYKLFAQATIEDVLGKSRLDSVPHLEIQIVRSSILKNLGDGNFEVSPLPLLAQVSNINGILMDDFNDDGLIDILSSGNFYSYRTQFGRNDSSLGLLLTGNGKGEFEPVSWDQSGFYAPGDIRNMTLLQGKDGRRFVLVARNNGKMSLFSLSDSDARKL
ncbi:MAG TPA: VCBS repeat-containing protein [Cyclobacteriaceae bacterium]|nr:VCBS repeat-containing protein [Cyclobacteriaceae bacterium]